MLRATLIAALLAFMASGCTTTVPIKGLIADEAQPFRGTVTSLIAGGGMILVSLENGVLCEGGFFNTASGGGDGMLECNDGRTGPVRFDSKDEGGTGTGELDGAPFSFTFGD